MQYPQRFTRAWQCLALACLLPTLALAQTGAPLRADFNAATGRLAFPNNLLFQGSRDGTLNIPIPGDAPANDPRRALNELDGFSTVNPIVATFSPADSAFVPPGAPAASLDPTSVVAGESVFLLEVELNNPFESGNPHNAFAVQRVVRALTPGVEYLATVSGAEGRSLAIVPLQPLKPSSHYLAVLTNALRVAGSGAAVVPDATYIFARFRNQGQRPYSIYETLPPGSAQALAALNPIIRSQEAAAASVGIRPKRIILSWTFSTQSVMEVPMATRTLINPMPIAVLPTGLSTAAISPASPGVADIYRGQMQSYYFLEAPSSDPTVILRSIIRGVQGSTLSRYNPFASATQVSTIPVLMTVPNAASGLTPPAEGWPVVIFQHGITANRSALLPIADALAMAGFAAIAIDLPLHGVVDSNSAIGQLLRDPGVERTFDVDLQDNASGAPGADGNPDASGAHFINLTSSLTTRSNLWQAVFDLFQVRESLALVDLDGDGQGDLNSQRVNFVGHSLGAIVGVPFLAVEDSVGAATLANGGGGLANMLLGSASYGPQIRTALTAAGLPPGTPEFEQFILAFQQAIDAADPVNFAAMAAALHPIHLPMVVGNGTTIPPDQVVPVAVPGAPLSGTLPMAAAMGLSAVDSSANDPSGLRALVSFTLGNHRSFLLPEGGDPPAANSPLVTLEMQSQAAAFMASDGTLLPINDPSVIAPGR